MNKSNKRNSGNKWTRATVDRTVAAAALNTFMRYFANWFVSLLTRALSPAVDCFQLPRPELESEYTMLEPVSSMNKSIMECLTDHTKLPNQSILSRLPFRI